MIGTLSKKTQQVLCTPELVIITERVDDVALLIAQMIRMGLPKILDKHIPQRGCQRELSWGWTAIIWLAYILTEGDHRKVSVAHYISRMCNTLSRVTGQAIEVLDFDDDRLSHLLRHLSKGKTWKAVERDLNRQSIEVYQLPTAIVRCDATTVSGFHVVKEGGLMQFGNSKDDPNLPQIKLAAASLDPLGMPLTIEVVSGEHADDTLYTGLIDRVNVAINKAGLLFVGDCKMSSLANRLHIASGGHFYLSPLPKTGCTAQEMPEWINKGLDKAREGGLESIFRENELGEKVLIATAYEFDRTLQEPLVKTAALQERVLVIHSPAYAERQSRGLEKRLDTAQQHIKALTPTVGRGKRQISEEEKLTTAIAEILKRQRVEGLLKVNYEKQCETQTRYIGKGRGSSTREQQTTEKIRYQISAVQRDESAIATAQQRFGWKAFVTNVAKSELLLSDAVLCYRKEYRIERIFNRLKNRLNIAPLFVKRDDQIEGLNYLLTLGVRVLTLIEFVVRRSLQKDNVKLPGLHPENHSKETDKPTAERLLKAFDCITLTIIQDTLGNEKLRWLSPLTAVQQTIMNSLELDGAYCLLQNSG
jgi:transposase